MKKEVFYLLSEIKLNPKTDGSVIHFYFHASYKAMMAHNFMDSHLHRFT